jgi:hypothetical protein
MRKITTAVTAVALSLSMLALAVPAAAVANYDSAYASESAFVNIAPGQTQSFQVIFVNTGTTTWTRGTATQVDLAACLEDKVTCNAQDASEAPWNSGWISAVRYATTTQTSVAPGSFATFSYNITAPANAAAGTYRFNGDLVLSTTGEKIHPEGYYQDATVASGGSASSLTLTPAFQFKQIGQNASLAIKTLDTNGAGTGNVSWTCNVVTAITIGGQQSVNPALTFSGTTDSTGASTLTYTRPNPGTDQVTCYVNANPIARANAQVQFGLASQTLNVGPKTAETHASNGTDCRTYTITVLDPNTGNALTTATTVTITYVEGTPAGVTPASGSTFVVAANTTSTTFNMCGTAAATATPIGTATISGQTYTDTGGSTTFQVPTATTATLSPSTATNFPSSSTASAQIIDNSPGEHRVTLSVKDQFGNSIASTTVGSTVYTVSATGGTVYILECGGVASTMTVASGGSQTCTTANTTTLANEHITIDSSTGGASATVRGVYTPSGGSALSSNTATKSWTTITASAEPTTGSFSGTVSFAEKRTCAGSSAIAPAGWYVLTVGSSSYLIHFDTTQSFAVTGVVASCDSFRAALSVGDVIVFTPGATAPNVIHNMTNNVP